MALFDKDEPLEQIRAIFCDQPTPYSFEQLDRNSLNTSKTQLNFTTASRYHDHI